MKKFIIGLILLFVGVAGMVPANAITVDFSVLPTTIDITSQNNPAGLTLNGVNMFYDQQGNTGGFAAADQLGIYGNTIGALIFNFNTPATALNFNFSVSGASGPDPNALIAIFSNNDFSTIPGTYSQGQIDGSLAYQGAAFTQATMYFSPFNVDSPSSNIFTVGNISYEAVQPVPVPSTLLLLGSGLVGLVGYGRRRFKK